MDPQTVKIALGLLAGLVVGVAAAVLLLRILAQKGVRFARDQAQEVMVVAGLQVETLRKEAELQAKEEAIRRREAIDLEIEDARKGFREQEKRLEKRTDVLDQKLDLYGATIELEFVEYIRPMVKFDSAAALAARPAFRRE